MPNQFKVIRILFNYNSEMVQGWCHKRESYRWMFQMDEMDDGWVRDFL